MLHIVLSELITLEINYYIKHYYLVVKNYVNKIKGYYLEKAKPYQKHRQRIKIFLDNQLIANSEGRVVEMVGHLTSNLKNDFGV